MKFLFVYLVLYSCLIYSQNIDMKIYNDKEGIEIIKKYNFKKSSDFKEDEEHIYYDGKENGFLVLNKHLNDFIFYNSKSDFKKVFLDSYESENPCIDFSLFIEKVPFRIKNLSIILNLDISLNDKLKDLKKVDLKLKELNKRYTKFPNEFMDFFSYYYVVLKNELEYNNIEIIEKKNQINSFFIFNNDITNKKEIFKDFYKLMIDDDSNGSVYLCAESIINPLNLKIGNINEPIIEDNKGKKTDKEF